MNPLKLITISVTAVLSLSLLLIIIYLLTKKFKSRINDNGKLKISFSIWYSALFLSGTIIIYSILNAIIEVIDNLLKINPSSFNLQLIKSSSLIIGVGFLWLIIWFFVANAIINILNLKTNEHQEMEDDNFSYFLIKAAILLGMIYSLSSVLALIIRTFIPNIEIPFYR